MCFSLIILHFGGIYCELFFLLVLSCRFLLPLCVLSVTLYVAGYAGYYAFKKMPGLQFWRLHSLFLSFLLSMLLWCIFCALSLWQGCGCFHASTSGLVYLSGSVVKSADIRLHFLLIGCKEITGGVPFAGRTYRLARSAFSLNE